MNPVTDWLPQPLTYRVGWTLLHFLWQGSLIALVHMIAQAALKKRPANARYAAACLALRCMALAPLFTFWWLSSDIRSPAHTPTTRIVSQFPARGLASPAEARSTESTSANSSSRDRVALISDAIEPALPWLTTIWLAGIAFLSARLFGGWLRVQRLRHQRTAPLGEPWISTLSRLRQRLEVTRPVLLLQSALVEVPTVVGWLKPIILLPASTLSGLSTAQLESILAHELAHIRRNDYLVNILQRLIETLLFFHPVVWWVSNCIRQEREHCCDDLAVSVCGDSVGYARALASLEELRLAGDEFALAAGDGSLTQRIQRLIQKSPPAQGLDWRRIALLLIVGATLCIIASRPDFGLPPKMYASTARIRIMPDSTDADRPDPAQYSIWLQTERERIASKRVLRKVISGLKLQEQFAKRSGKESVLSSDETIALLEKRLSVRLIPNTMLIAITALSEDPQEAASIANMIAEIYSTDRHDYRQMVSSKPIAALKQQRTDQEVKLREAERIMEQLRKKTGVTDINMEGERASTVEPEIVRNMERAKSEVEIKLNSFETLLKELKNVPKDQLADSIPNTSYADPRLNELLNQRGNLETQRAQLKEEIGEQSPRMVAINEAIKRTSEQIDARVNGLIRGLEIELSRHKKQIEFLTKAGQDARQRDAEIMAMYRPFLDAKSDLEAQKRIYETINLRLIQEAADSKLPKHSPVEVVDLAEPALRPIGRPWFWRN